ncbi:tetratricopeptide repeat protein [Streptomyces sp. ActVer]|uniref:tetratricopeptide repeat protein n=1 Tax=Streptomyces sp. ActVer TaxID=3014558 RepID=UPI0022B2B684|nr:tetratricopeptide repeat protein [Streptomyces sp. ActVer]MCZ4510249.1 tetratricopeptide repeat protein [Streptomyces sp. ActVer]
MYGKAFAPEYQGALTTLSVNSSLVDVLAAGTEQLRAAERAGAPGEVARSGLAVAEAHRRLGQVDDADRAWKASYRAAREAGDTAAMAWALWSGGTLARQRGAFPLAWRLLGLAAEFGERGGDIVVRGYSLAGMAETGRIQGDYEAVGALHEQLLAEARKRGEARHTVWALEGIAQIHRNTGSYDTAYAMFEEAAEIAGRADDRRGHAWALRGLADIVSVRDGDAERALDLLAEAEVTCREMNLSSALAYNHKMRGNVLYRAGRYAEARDVYTQALAEFRAMSEPRGEALSRLGLAKSLAHLGHDLDDTAAELADLAQVLERTGLRHARQMVARAQAEFGIVADADANVQTATVPDAGPRTGPGASANSGRPTAVDTETPAATPTAGSTASTLAAADAGTPATALAGTEVRR